MSRFYASIQGDRGEATRQGTAKSGITGHIRGWDIGVRIDAYAVEETDVFYIFASSGSNNYHSKFIGSVELFDGKPTFIPAPK